MYGGSGKVDGFANGDFNSELHNLYVEDFDVFLGFLFVHPSVLDFVDHI